MTQAQNFVGFDYLSALQYLSDGMTGKQVADRMGLNYQSYKNYMKDIRRLRGAKTTTHLVAIAMRELSVD